jgi:hypothetical protein
LDHLRSIVLNLEQKMEQFLEVLQFLSCTYGGVTTGEALAILWAAGVRQVELAIGPKPSPDTLEVLRQYQQQGM